MFTEKGAAWCAILHAFLASLQRKEVVEKSGEIYDTYHDTHDRSDTVLTNPKTDLLAIIQLSGTRPRFNDRELSHLGVESGEAPGNTVGSRMEQTMEHSGERGGATPGSTVGSGVGRPRGTRRGARWSCPVEHSGERGGDYSPRSAKRGCAPRSPALSCRVGRLSRRSYGRPSDAPDPG